MKHSQALLALITASFATLSLGYGTPRGCFPRNRAIEPAAVYSREFPYLYATADGQPASLAGNKSVPAAGDKLHEFQHPVPGAYRGPCPGLNIAANYGFLSRDGVSTFDELVAAQQNMYNFGYDISVVFAAAGVGLDGDLDTGLLSIGSNASCAGVEGGGLAQYRVLEADMSLTRTDYTLSKNGDNFSLNLTLWQSMVDTVASTSSKESPIFDAPGMAKFKALRFEQSKAENGEFSFNPVTILYYAAATALYELFPGQGPPDYALMSTIYGAQKLANGSYATVPERLPAGWRNRSRPYTLRGIITQIHVLYTQYYKEIGHTEGAGNFIVDADHLQFPPNGTVTDLLCWIYDSFTGRGRVEPSPVPLDRLRWITNRINPHFSREGCQIIEL